MRGSSPEDRVIRIIPVREDAAIRTELRIPRISCDRDSRNPIFLIKSDTRALSYGQPPNLPAMNSRLPGILAVLSLALLATARSTAADRPNIVHIVADDLGWKDVGFNGCPDIKTPNLDKLAAEGVKLAQFYVQPMCTPTRAALLTGCYPKRISLAEITPVPGQKARSGRVLYAHSPFGLNPDEITIAEVLKSRGYATGMVGK